MDYKKMIIINLAFLIILGKLMLVVFHKMQRNINRIDIENYKLLKLIFNYEMDENISDNHTGLGIESLQKFTKEFNEILKKYEFITEYKNNLDKNTIIELEEIKLKVININKFCSELKTRKLKFFCLILLLISLLNYAIVIKFSPYENYKMVKEKIKLVLQKLNKISPYCHKDDIKNNNSENENEDRLSKKNILIQNITEKKNN